VGVVPAQEGDVRPLAGGGRGRAVIAAVVGLKAVVLAACCCCCCHTRSTLDPVLRKEVHGLDWKGLALLATAALYMFATPGALVGVGGCASACADRRSDACSLTPGCLPRHTQQPGVLPGALDYYVSAPLQRSKGRIISKVGVGVCRAVCMRRCGVSCAGPCCQHTLTARACVSCTLHPACTPDAAPTTTPPPG
jgi:hypothetical protein